MEIPKELYRVENAVTEFQQFLASNIPHLNVQMISDKATKEQDSDVLQKQCGVYVLFYHTGIGTETLVGPRRSQGRTLQNCNVVSGGHWKPSHASSLQNDSAG